MLDYLKDYEFLHQLDLERNKFYWVKIEVLDMREVPIQAIEGKVLPGSTISIAGDSSVRRTCSIIFLADDAENDLTNIDNLLSINKKIRIFTGLNNDIDDRYDNIIWFPQGIYVITQPNISHNASGCRISLSCKDKMCLLNGECGGNFPTSVTFHEYSQVMGEEYLGYVPDNRYLPDYVTDPNNYTIYTGSNYQGEKVYFYHWDKLKGWSVASESDIGSIVDVPQLIFDIIQTLVCNYGGEPISKIFINDVPLEIKQLVRYTGSNALMYNTVTRVYELDSKKIPQESADNWRPYTFNEDVGYMYVDFTYPGELISNIGDNVCTILDKIKSTLGSNFEYFYDLDGNFIFQEKKNYLNNTYNVVNEYRLDNISAEKLDPSIDPATYMVNSLSIIDNTNYKVDFNSNTKLAYSFTENNGLVASYSNTPVYSNLKNDFHIWGENEDKYAIHYHLAIKKKPQGPFATRQVVFYQKNGKYTGALRLADGDETGEAYQPIDWRAELYLRGLEKIQLKQRPDIYEQELLDLFDGIYDFKEKQFKTDMVYKPNVLNYFFDYLEPEGKMADCSVDVLGTRMYSYKQDKMIKLYNTEVPNNILISTALDNATRRHIIDRCIREGQTYSNINPKTANFISVGTVGYSGQEVAQSLLYQYTNYNESITIQSLPIYYLDVNTRISVFDKKSGISGDYIIKSISMPIGFGMMNITATKVQREDMAAII